MSEIDAEEVVKSVRYQNVRIKLEKMGITDYQTWLLETAREAQFDNRASGKGYKIQDHEYDGHHLNWAKTMMKVNLVDVNGSSYWLTSKGLKFREELLANKTAPQGRMTGKYDVVKRDDFDEKMDVDLFRDGLLATAGKIYWFWTNRDLIKERQMQAWLKEFQEGQAEIDKAIAAILAPRETPIVPHVQQENPYWSEEMQRKQNDLYWMTDGIAFWLNPRGLLADPTPAPDWWSPPLDYQPKVTLPDFTDKILEASLLPPPTDALPAGMVKASDEEIRTKQEEKARETMLDELIYELDKLNDPELVDEFYDAEDWYEEIESRKAHKTLTVHNSQLPSITRNSNQSLFIVEFENEVRGFPTAGEAQHWINIMSHAKRLKDAEERARREAAEAKRIRNAIQDDLIRQAKKKIRGQDRWVK